MLSKLHNSISRASHIGDDATLRTLLRSRGARYVVDGDIGEITPLMAASACGHCTTMQLLLRNGGANPNHQTPRFRQTALHIASVRGQLAAVNVLLQANADARLAGSDGMTPLINAAHSGHTAVVRRLITALGGGAIDLNHATIIGCTAIYLAAQEGHADVIRVLTEAGADPRLALHNGASPLSVATKYGHLHCVQALVAAGVSVHDIVDSAQRTALFVAVVHARVDIVRFLIAASANVDHSNCNGVTPLITAAVLGRTAIVQCLIDAGAKLDCADANGSTALQHAQNRGHAEVVAMLTNAAEEQSKSTVFEVD